MRLQGRGSDYGGPYGPEKDFSPFILKDAMEGFEQKRQDLYGFLEGWGRSFWKLFQQSSSFDCEDSCGGGEK